LRAVFHKTIGPMLNRTWFDLLARPLAAVCGLALVTLATLPAQAEEEDDTPFETKILRNLLGAKPDIDYRERSPLVIPPSAELPAPESGAPVERTAAWPQDPDLKKRKDAGRQRASSLDAMREQGRALTPEELRQGKVAGKGRVTGPAPTQSDNEMGRPLRGHEMGQKSLFSYFSSGPEKPETFTGEPTRSRLTEPPTGYRTPSAGQAYAPPKDTGNWLTKPLSVFDRGLKE
jgi:hypothetical protein